MSVQNLRICYFGTYRAEYSRNIIMIEGLRRAGVDVIECQEQLWSGIEERIDVATGGWKRPTFLIRLVTVYLRLTRRFFSLQDFDILVVGYPGQMDVFLARMLSWLRRKPLVWDIFMSIYLIALERKLDQKSKLSIQLIKALERTAARLPICVILDTPEYVQWFAKTHSIPIDHFRLVPTGADDRIFHPSEELTLFSPTSNILYYGTFIPNHGVPYIIEAAHLLKDHPEIKFTLIGDGPDRLHASQLCADLNLSNVTFIDWMDQASLVRHIQAASICLGAFGTTPQSLMTVQNKIYECLATGKPVISGDSPTVRRSMIHRKQIFLVERANPSAIMKGILELVTHPELAALIAEGGKTRFTEHFTTQKIGEQFKTHLLEIIHPEKVQPGNA